MGMWLERAKLCSREWVTKRFYRLTGSTDFSGPAHTPQARLLRHGCYRDVLKGGKLVEKPKSIVKSRDQRHK